MKFSIMGCKCRSITFFKIECAGCTNEDVAASSSGIYPCIEPGLQEFELDSKLNFHYTSHLKNSRLRTRIEPVIIEKI